MLKHVKDSILSIGKSLKEPVFLKEYSGIDKTISELENLKNRKQTLKLNMPLKWIYYLSNKELRVKEMFISN